MHKNVQNQPNIVQNSQNNVQNALNFEKTGQKSQVTLPNEIRSFVENRNKVAPGLSVQMDNTLNTDGVIVQNQDGTRTIKVNPSSNNAYEFVTMHEMLHDLSGTQEYQELANFVKERAMTHDTFEESKQTITDKYTKYYQENGLDMSSLDMDIETINDMTAQALGNQDFLNELASKKPNVFMRIWNWIKNVLFDGQKTGKTFSERRADNKYLNELKKKFETAYNTAYKGNGETKYSIQTDNNGNKYVKVDTDQNIFEGVEKKDYPKIARMYMQDYLKGNTALGNNSTANIGNKGISKYTNPIQQTQYKNEKMKLSTELNNILAVSEKVSEGLPTKDTSKFPNWEYYKVNFEIDGKTFEGLINIGVDKNGNKHFYDINKIRITSNSHISASKSSNTDFINYSIPSTEGTVNNQYMQNSPNNAEEHYSIGGNGYSGHSMSNNAIKAYEEGKKPISKFTKEDVNTFNQLLQERGISEKITLKELKTLLEKYSGSEWHHTSSRYNKTNFYDINDVLENDNSDIENTIKEIRDSKEKSANVKEILKTKLGETEKEYYTRIGNYVIDKRIKNYNKDGLNFLAVQEEESRKNPSYVYGVGRASGVLDYGAKYTPQGLENSSSFSLPETDNQGRKLTKEQQEYFKDSKVRDENGNLLTMYHGTPNGNFTVFNSGSYFTPNKEYASGYQRGNASILNYGKEETNPRTYEVYLNIANPFTLSNPIAKDIYINEYIKGGHALGINPYLSDTEYDKIQSIDWTEGEDLKEFLIENNYDYDGLILDEGGMGGYDEEVKNRGNSYVIFDAKQVKSVDNTTPTNNSDIRYSQSDKSWSKYLKEYWDLMPNAKKTFGLPTAEELQNFDNEQAKEAYKSLHMKNESENSGMKERSFVKNANTTSWIPEEFKGITGEYTPISNAETLAKAHERINNEDYQSVKDSFLANDLRDATDTAIGELLMQKAINDKNYKDYNTITCALAEKLTRAGQAIQAASILKRLTPDGMIMYAQKQLKNARIAIERENKKLYEELKEKGELPELNEEDTKFIYEKMEKANELGTSNYWGKENRQKEILIGQALTRIANKIPSTALDIVAGIRRNGLLFNLKTLKRNVGSNLAFSLQEAIKDIPATVADEITSFFTGKRTTKLPNISAYWKGMKKGSVEAVEDVKYGISTAGGGSKYELPSKVFKRTDTWSDILQKYKSGEIKEGTEATFKRLLSDYEDTAMFIVEGTDRPFWQGRFESELANQMELNGLEYGKDIPTEEMLETAKESADYATFKNENKVSRFLGNTRNLLNNGKAIGVADALGLTFTNVPGSVASKAYDYSPFGLTKVLTEIKNLATKKVKFNQQTILKT